MYDKLKSKTSITEIVPTITLAILSISTIALEIIFTNQNTTKIETTLFGILEIVFTVGFSWLLAKHSYRKDFEERQKSFAVAAYRRILEIERAINRLLERVTTKMNVANGELKLELDVIKEITTGLCDTTLSSVSDWSDIIGEEINKIREIETVRREEQSLKSQIYETQHLSSNAESEYQEKIKELEMLKRSLIKSLPNNLQVVASSEKVRNDSAGTFFRRLKSIYEEKGSFQVEGFWADGDDKGFVGNLEDIKPGNILTVAISDLQKRESCFIVFDKNKQPVGMLFNQIHTWGSTMDGYDAFTSIIVRTIKSSKFEIEITSVKDKIEKDRLYFKAKFHKVL